MEETTSKRASRRQQLLYTLMPLFLLALCLSAINLAPALVVTAGTNPSIRRPAVDLATPAVAERPVTIASTPLQQEVVTTPSLLPTATLHSVATFPPGTEFQLLGPPSGSSFRISDALSFYWQWPLALEDDQSVALYLLTEDQELLLGRLAEPNIGASYRLHVVPGDFVSTARTVQWQVRLESAGAVQWLAASEIRPLALLPARSLVP